MGGGVAVSGTLTINDNGTFAYTATMSGSTETLATGKCTASGDTVTVTSLTEDGITTDLGGDAFNFTAAGGKTDFYARFSEAMNKG